MLRVVGLELTKKRQGVAAAGPGPQPRALGRQRLPKAGAENAPLLHGIGTDVLHVARLDAMLERQGRSRLLPRLLMPAERREVRQRRDLPRALAMCWAAKEAFAKAYGTGFRGFGWRDVGVVREANGRPVLIFSRRMKTLMRAAGVSHAHLSLSDDSGVVCAYVILERAG